MGLKVQGLGLRVQGLGFRIQASGQRPKLRVVKPTVLTTVGRRITQRSYGRLGKWGYMLQDAGCRDEAWGFGTMFGFKVQSVGCRVLGVGCRV